MNAATPYINLSRALQGFYATRGMWLNGRPQGWLAGILGARMLGPSAACGELFFISIEHLEELAGDIATNGRRGMSGHQVSQTLRRLRESAKRAGQQSPFSDRANAPAEAESRKPADRACVPFEPLICPAQGKARRAFEHHVMDCLHAVVAFSQESVYVAASDPREDRESAEEQAS